MPAGELAHQAGIKKAQNPSSGLGLPEYAPQKRAAESQRGNLAPVAKIRGHDRYYIVSTGQGIDLNINA
jgi:hypothetical protein